MQTSTASIAPTRDTLVIMGVSGSGKTRISQGVARSLGWRHIDADEFHTSENVERMRAGIPLSDEDRRHWLDALSVEMQATQARGQGFVLACSALKRDYRERLREAVPGLQFVYLQIDHPTALLRMTGRSGHFMPGSLLNSQFAALESPEGEPHVLTVSAAQSCEQLIVRISAWIRRKPS